MCLIELWQNWIVVKTSIDESTASATQTSISNASSTNNIMKPSTPTQGGTTMKDVPAIIVPLYIYPVTASEVLAPEWQKLVEASAAPGVRVVAVVNPGSGPGLESDRSNYSFGMKALFDAGVQVAGYVSSGYGKVDKVPEAAVFNDIRQYKEWYGEWVTSIFLDEMVCNEDEAVGGDGIMTRRYGSYQDFVKETFGPTAEIFLNSGVMETSPSLATTKDSIVNFLENSHEALQELDGPGGCPPPAPEHAKGRASFLLHGSSLSPESLRQWVHKLVEGGWSHLYITERVFDPEKGLWNPWNSLTRYWDQIVAAISELHEAEGALGQEEAEKCVAGHGEHKRGGQEEEGHISGGIDCDPAPFHAPPTMPA
ncbi:unnamed protein product [Discosporangium mesarthrocarpum]